jgi:hypothetical protein
MEYCAGWLSHCQVANWIGMMVDQSVGMVIVGHQENIQWLLSKVEHGWQLEETIMIKQRWIDSHLREGWIWSWDVGVMIILVIKGGCLQSLVVVV